MIVYDIFMVEKIAGYVLLVFGFMVIFFSLSNIFMIMNRTSEPIQFVDMDAIVLKQNIPLSSFPESIRPQLEEAINGAAPMVLMNKKDINQSTNFMFHIFIMGFFINAGSAIATLGTKLIREVNIKVDANQTKTAPTV